MKRTCQNWQLWTGRLIEQFTRRLNSDSDLLGKTRRDTDKRIQCLSPAKAARYICHYCRDSLRREESPYHHRLHDSSGRQAWIINFEPVILVQFHLDGAIDRAIAVLIKVKDDGADSVALR